MSEIVYYNIPNMYYDHGYLHGIDITVIMIIDGLY